MNKQDYLEFLDRLESSIKTSPAKDYAEHLELINKQRRIINEGV